MLNALLNASLSLPAALCVLQIVVPLQVHAEPQSPPTTPLVQATTMPAKPTPNSVIFLNVTVPEQKEVNGITTVHGQVFEDLDGNEKRDLGELALKGVSLSVQLPGQDDSSVPALTTTDEQGAFDISAPANAVITLNAPDGWRIVGPSSRFAKTEMVFALRPMQSVVERVMPAPVVNVQPTGMDIKTTWPMLAALVLGLCGLGWGISHALNRQTLARSELADWQVQWQLTHPGAGKSIQRQVGNEEQSILSTQLPLLPLKDSPANPSDTAYALAKSDLHQMAVAVSDSPGLPNLSANASDSFGRVGQGGWCWDALDEAHWFTLVEQAVADGLHESVKIDGFLGMAPLPNAWMRFSTRDGQVFTFGIKRTSIQSCHWWEARRINPLVTARCYADLRLIYQHYAHTSNLPGALPRDSSWFVFSERGFVVLREDEAQSLRWQ